MSNEYARPNRRMLLAGLGAGAVGAAAASAAPVFGLRLADTAVGRLASGWDRTSFSLAAAGLAEWTALVGEAFVLQTAAGSHTLKVAAVTAFPRSGPRPASLARSQAFSIAFEAVAGPALPAADRLYQLTHKTYPTLAIYLGAPVKVGAKTQAIAVFN